MLLIVRNCVDQIYLYILRIYPLYVSSINGAIKSISKMFDSVKNQQI